MSEALEEFVNKIFPNLKDTMKMAQMTSDITTFVLQSFLLSIIFSINFSLVSAFIFRKLGFFLVMAASFLFFLIIFFLIALNIPKLNIKKVSQDIESDIFIPSRMLLTLLESGNSLVTAMEEVSYTKAKSSKYFGKIASEVFLGKNIEQAIEDAIRFTPSESFCRVLEPIKKSLRTGTDIERNLISTLEELQKEKIIEIENYEKKLSPIAMFYMIFGTILPAMGIVAITIILSVIGIEVTFFPFLFLLMLFLTIIQFIFLGIFRAIRPKVNL
jgi:archaellum biogenesis protein FlaJ (TadC family)